MSSCVYDYNFCVQCFRKFFQCHVIQKNLLITFQHAAWDQKLLSKIKTGKLLFQILPGDQTGHCDLFTEKTILDGCDRNLHIGIFLLDFFYIACDKRRRQFSCGDPACHLTVVTGKPLQRFFYFCFQKPEHSHTIFKLQISIIFILTGKLPVCQNIPFV